jgi:hypothetical protein
MFTPVGSGSCEIVWIRTSVGKLAGRFVLPGALGAVPLNKFSLSFLICGTFRLLHDRPGFEVLEISELIGCL